LVRVGVRAKGGTSLRDYVCVVDEVVLMVESVPLVLEAAIVGDEVLSSRYLSRPSGMQR